LQQAEAAYRRALELQPRSLAALAGLASLCSRRGDHEEARRLAAQVLEAEPNYPDATQVVAAADLAAGAPERAESRMRGLLAEPRLSPLERAIAHGFLADALDAQGRTEEAFAAYATCNEERRRIYAPRYADGPGTLDVLHWTTNCVEEARPAEAARKPAGAEAGGARAHVFLLGFPRSGTTLLEQALGGHSEVATLDERETLIDAVRAFMKSPADLERFFTAANEELRDYREQYWLRVRDAGAQVAGRVFVDKHPLHTLKLPLIARLFPHAKILFARRDPRDVVLSCFRRRFRMSAPMYALLTLPGAAALYDGAMRLAERVDAVLPLARHIVRHESLVADFEAQVGAICAFAGLEWSDAMRDFARRVRDNTSATPSAAQLARGLSAEGIGQWRRYRNHLTPVLPLLDPWVERFGYAPE
jgi:tetratricopeptide (TPR) repeat protein